MNRIATILTIAAASVAFACGGGEKSKTGEVAEAQPVETPVTAVTPPPAELPPDQGEGIAWADKSEKQRTNYMKHTVKPRMQELFAEFDPEKFAEVKCTTCHGSSVREGNFQMPNPELPKLDDWDKLKAEQPEMLEFMRTRVVPEMAALLGQEPFNPETKTGFGCSGCHGQ